MILSAHISGTANSAVSLSGVVTSLKNKESSKMNLAAKFSTFHITLFFLGNLFLGQIQVQVFKIMTNKISSLNFFDHEWQIGTFQDFYFYNV